MADIDYLSLYNENFDRLVEIFNISSDELNKMVDYIAWRFDIFTELGNEEQIKDTAYVINFIREMAEDLPLVKFTFEKYTDKSYVLRKKGSGGEEYRDVIENYLKGIWNKNLKGGEGWIFPSFFKDQVEYWLRSGVIKERRDIPRKRLITENCYKDFTELMNSENLTLTSNRMLKGEEVVEIIKSNTPCICYTFLHLCQFIKKDVKYNGVLLHYLYRIAEKYANTIEKSLEAVLQNSPRPLSKTDKVDNFAFTLDQRRGLMVEVFADDKEYNFFIKTAEKSEGDTLIIKQQKIDFFNIVWYETGVMSRGT